MHASNEEEHIGTEQQHLSNGCPASKGFYQQLIQCAPNVVLFLSPDHLILEFNPEAERLYGHKKEDVLGKDYFEEFLPDDAREAVAADIEKVMAGKPTRGYENLVTAHDGQKRILRWNVDRVLDSYDKPVGIIAVGQEITEREKQEKLAGIQRDLAIKLSAATELGAGLSLCLETAICASGMDCGGIYLIDEYSGTLELAAHQRLSAEFVKSVSHYDMDSNNIKLVMKGEPVYTEHKQLDVILDQPQKNEGLRAIAVVPVPNEGRVIGCLNIASHVLNHIHAQSRLAMETIAAQIGSTVARLKTAKALRESEDKYRTLFESANDAIFTLQVSGNNLNFKECNSHTMEMFGCRREDIIGKSPVDFSPPVQPDGTLSTERAAQLCTAAVAGEPQHFEWKHCLLDGTEFDAEVTLNRIDIAGETCLQAIVRDITERKKAEAALQESENRYRTVVENAGEGIVVTQDRTLKFINPHFTDITGYSEEEFKSRPFIEFVHPDDREQVMEIHNKRLKGEEVPHAYEFRAIHKQGNTMWLENNGILIEWGGRPASLNFLRDITERKEAEQKIKSSEERFKVLFEYAPDAYYMTDLQGRFVDGNLAAEQTIGYKREELIGKSFLKLKLLSPGQIPKAAKLLAKSALGRPTGPDEFVLNRKDGTKVEVEIRTYPVQIDGQALILGIARDITERKKAEEALRAERDKLKALMDGITRARIGIDIVDVNHRILFQNETLEQIFGKIHDEPCYKHYMALEEPCDQCPAVKAIQQNKAVEVQQRGLDGRDYQIFSAPVPDADGTVSKAIEIVMDITERKQAEAERIRLINILETTSDFVSTSTPDGELTYINRAGKRMLGWTEDDICDGRKIPDAHPDWAFRVIKNEGIPTAIESGVWEGETALLRSDGTEIPASQVIMAHKAPDGKVEYFSTITRDITERKQAEEALVASESKYRSLFDSSIEGIGLSKGNCVISANKALLDIFGYESIEEFAKIPLLDHVAPESRELIQAFIRKREQRPFESLRFEYKIIRKDGEVRDLEISTTRISIEGEVYSHSTFQDITDRKKAEEKLREQRDRAQKYLDVAGVMFVVIDSQGNVVLVNKKGCEVLGYEESEIFGRNWFDNFLPEPQREVVKGVFKKLLAEEIEPVEYFENPVLTKEKRERIIAWHNILLRDQDGNIIGTLSSGQDITEHKEAEKRIKEYQARLKSLASELSLAEERERRRIAAGIHDEIAQKLAMMKFELQSLQTSVKDTDISGSLEKQSQLMDQVVADARSLTFELGNPVLYQVGLEAAVESYLTERIQEEFGIKCKFKSEGPLSSLDEDIKIILFQAVRELTANVVKHASASTIEVCFSNTKDRLRIVVADDGVGFDPAKIWPDATKQGGFGLFNIRERLEYFGGNIEIESRPKNGTCVTMTIAMRTDAIAE